MDQHVQPRPRLTQLRRPAWGFRLFNIAISSIVIWSLIVVGCIVALVVLAMAWFYISMLRGGAKRDKLLYLELDPLAERIEAHETVTPEDVLSIARRPQYRPLLYSMLKYYEKLDLFPKEYLSEQAQAEADLTYWMMHPHELRDPPESMHLVETLNREVAGKPARMYVFRFRMPEDHWAGPDGWQLGVSGPFFNGDLPYANNATSFVRGNDRFGEAEPAELVDWFLATAEQKGILPGKSDD